MSWEWKPRAEPLEPMGLVVQGQAARELVKRLLEHPRPDLTGVHTRNCLVLLGPDLPWVDGVVYLGRETPLDAVLTPTHLQPSWPTEWIASALQRQSSPPWAVLPEQIIGLSRASRLEEDVLRACASL